MEGGMKDLNPAILDAVDLDAPPDLLRFTILIPPAHGTLLHGLYGLDMSRYKDRGPEILQRSLPVHSFTVQALRQGQLDFRNPPGLELCLVFGVEWEVCQCSALPQGWLPRVSQRALVCSLSGPDLLNRCCRRQRSWSACGASATSAKVFPAQLPQSHCVYSDCAAFPVRK